MKVPLGHFAISQWRFEQREQQTKENEMIRHRYEEMMSH